MGETVPRGGGGRAGASEAAGWGAGRGGGEAPEQLGLLLLSRALTWRAAGIRAPKHRWEKTVSAQSSACFLLSVFSSSR